MANTFTLTSKAYKGRYLEVTCQQTPSVEGNTSEISWVLAVKGGDDPYYSTGPTTLTIGGQQVYYGKRKSYTTHAFPTGKGSVSGKLTVSHDELGACAVEVTLSTAIYTETISTVSEAWQLEDIQRASKIRAADAYIGSCATVVIGRSSGSFTHTVSYAFGGLMGWLDALGDPVAEPVRHGETTLNFLLPESFYGEIPDKPRDSCVLVCFTYREEELVGQTECSFWVAADPELCRPVVTAQVVPGDDLTLSLNNTKLIPGFSTARCLVDATAQKDATLISVTAGDVKVTDGEAFLPGWLLPSITVMIVDSRGYETHLEVPCYFVDYVPPVNLSDVARPEPTADSAVVTLRGSAFCGAFEQSENYVEAVVDFDERQVIVPLTLNGNGEFTQTVVLEDLAYTKNYPIVVTIRDLVTGTSKDLTVKKGIPVFDWGENDFRFHVPVDMPDLTVDGVPLSDYIRSIMEGA